uniref:Uncharacterized protein n=1 Tax=Candidatus Kentrum sp. TC TaxID=2126339 RepID=A0A450YLT6_9GAMM|nr:MAG: hypothetical protein BECKTC1821E_GA0114239_101919 [Candidatus Kentron sp. TC]
MGIFHLSRDDNHIKNLRIPDFGRIGIRISGAWHYHARDIVKEFLPEGKGKAEAIP